MTTDEKVRENRLRRMADRQGLRLVKSRRRDPRSLDYGKYLLIDHQYGGSVMAGWEDIDTIETYLTDE